MLKVPAKEEVAKAGAKGLNGVTPQEQWLDVVKTDGCYTCHQLGNKATRTIPPQFGEAGSAAEAWERRIQSGQAQPQMVTNIQKLDPARAFALFGEWSERIAKGELPAAKPERP